MSLFVQMFRFAAEPFFFQRASDRNSKELYAVVMEYFTAFCGLIFIGVLLYIDVISLILGRDFREGISIVPVMLLSYMILGMLFNVSMWYKLSGKTVMAIYITLAGLAVTAAVNIVFMPVYSYHAAAWGHLASYLVMFLIRHTPRKQILSHPVQMGQDCRGGHCDGCGMRPGFGPGTGIFRRGCRSMNRGGWLENLP